MQPARAKADTASLFVTCVVDQFYPRVGVSVVRVLRRLGVSVSFPADQTCCGQPLYNSGFTRPTRQLAQRVLRTFGQSQYVVVPSGSCATMMRVSYPELFRNEPDSHQQAIELSQKVYEFSEFLVKVLGVTDVGADYHETATYHPSCHLERELGVKHEPQLLLNNVRQLELKDLPGAENCCGFGGTFSVKYPVISEAMLAEKLANIAATGATTLVACDMGCLMHLGGAINRQGLGINVLHLAQVLDHPCTAPSSDSPNSPEATR